MSTEADRVAAKPGGDANAGSAETRAMLRFAFGVTLAIGLSQLIAWPVAFIAPIFLALLLQSPRPLPLAGALAFMFILISALAVGLTLGAFLRYVPVVCVLLLILLYCANFYWALGGASQLLVLLVIIGLTMMPVIGIQSLDIALQVVVGLVTSGFVALLLAWIMFALLPGREAPGSTVAPPPSAKSQSERFVEALIMTAIIAPLAIAFLLFGWSQLIVLIIPAILVQQLSLAAGFKGGLALLVANFAGGIVAVGIYNLLVAAPYFIMLMALLLLVSLIFAKRIFSGTPTASLWSSAFTAIVIIVCGAVAPFGDDADAKLVDRLGQLLLAVIYIGFAFTLAFGFKGNGDQVAKDQPGGAS